METLSVNKSESLLKPALPEPLSTLAGNLSSLWNAVSQRTLLRQFGQILVKSYSVTCLDFIRVRLNPFEVIKKRHVKIAGVSFFDEFLSDQLVVQLKHVIADHQGISDGINFVAYQHRSLAMVILRDHDDELTLAIWDGKHHTPEQQMQIDLLVRATQNECRWIRQHHSAQALIYRDDLTGLYNTRYLEVALDNELKRADRFGHNFCLLFIDLDGFKPINDTYGHLAGSSILRQVAHLIRDTVRDIDGVIRYGGDEYIVLLIGAGCAKGAMVAERVRRRISEFKFSLKDSKAAHITCSIGVAAFPDHGTDRETLIRMADESMYDSKRSGKNRVTVLSRNLQGSMAP